MGTLTRIKCSPKCFLLVILLVFSVVESGKFGGGGRSWSSRPASRPSYSRPSPSPSYSRPSPSPSYSRPSPSPSYSRPSVSHPSPASLSYPSWYQTASRLSPGASRPSPKPIGFDNFKPAGPSSSGSSFGTSSGSKKAPVGPPNYGFNAGASQPPSIGFKPPVTQGAGVKPSAPLEHASVAKPVGSSIPGSHGSNPPPIGFKPSVSQGSNVQPAPVNLKPLGNANSGSGHGATPPPYGFKPSAPVGPPTNVKPVGNLPPGVAYPVQPPPYSPYSPPSYNPAHNPAGYGPPPAYNPSYYNPGHPPAYNPGYGQPNYPQQQYHPGGYGYPNQPHYGGSPGGITNININNNNNHHYGGGYGGGFGGGYGGGFGGGYGGFGYPSYHYSHSDTGSGALGFFLGYSLAKVTTPTFHYSSFSSGYTPRYDHYEVHHYYHNRDSVPAQSTIQPNTIVGCIGDSGTICPTGTTSLCTNNGAILCVASATTTVPCSDQKQGNCVKTTIPCVKGTGDCEVGTNKTITIPCISNAKVHGNITYVNNTIIVHNTTIINNHFNGTLNETVSTSNSSAVMASSSIVNGTVPLANLTDSALATLNNVTSNSTVTTTTLGSITEVPTTLPPDVSTDTGTRSKRGTPPEHVNEFCVTILAVPAERKPSEPEQILSKGTSIFSKFLVKALGAN